MLINLVFIKIYLGKYLVWGFEILPLRYRGKSLFGITWDNYGNEITLFIDLFYKNILDITIKK